MKKSHAYILAVLVALAGWAGWTLVRNKKTVEKEASFSQHTRSWVPVEVVNPTRENLTVSLETSGIFFPAKEMFVISETQGRVLEVFKNKGEWVREGEAIAKVDDELLRIELEATQANLAKLRKDLSRMGNLVEGEAVAKNRIEEIELGILAAEAKEKGLTKQIANTSIRAPMTGTLGLRFIERGSVIGPGIQVAQITNLEKVLLMVKVSERDILRVRKGQAATVTADVFPNITLSGVVTNIGLKADNAFNYDVEIEVRNPENPSLRAGMHAKAVFRFDAARNGLTLPRKAIAGSLQDPKVYRITGDSTAELVSVALGTILGDKVEVLSGLKPDEQVVVTGQINLTNGTRVKVLQAGEGKPPEF